MVLISSRLWGLRSWVWIFIWIMIELNTMAICYILRKEQFIKKKKISNTIKYFLVQIIGSTFILIASTSQEKTSVQETTIILALVLKMGVWPLHSWYIKLISSIPLTGIALLRTITWQKVLPTILLRMIPISESNKTLTLVLAILRIISPLSETKKNFKKKKSLALSSLNSNGWLLLASSQSVGVTIIFIGFYLFILLDVVEFLKKERIIKRTKETTLENLIAIRNIIRIPPIPIFWVKIILIINSISILHQHLLMLIVLLSSCVISFLYLYFTLPSTIVNNKKTQTTTIKKNVKSKTSISILIIVRITLMIWIN